VDAITTTELALVSEVVVYSNGSVPLVFSNLCGPSIDPRPAAGQACQSAVSVYLYQKRRTLMSAEFENAGLGIEDAPPDARLNLPDVQAGILRDHADAEEVRASASLAGIHRSEF